VVLPAVRRVLRDAYGRVGPAPACTHRERRWLLVIVLTATALRLAWVLYAAREPRGFHDPTLYGVFAARIADGHGYTFANGEATTYYPVGYVGALGAVVRLVGLTPIPENISMTAAVFNLVLGVGTVVLTFEVGRRLFDNRTGLIAAAVVALWPNLIFHTAVILTETLFIFLVMAAVLVLVALPASTKRIGWRRPAVFGVILALSALVRPISLMLLPVLLLVLIVAGTGWRLAIGYVGIATLAVVLVLTPWTIRNVRETDSFVVISTNLGDNLCMSRHAGATGAFQSGSACIVRAKGLKRPEYEVEVNNTNIRRAVQFVRSHPLSEAKLVFLRGYHTVENDHDGLLASESYGANPFIPSVGRRFLEIVANAYFFVAVVLGLLAVPAFLGRHRPWRLFFLLAAAALAVQPLIFFGDPRFHVPVLPFVAVLAAVLLTRTRSLFTARSDRAVTETSRG
jgi:4-amino-4-deoxy-L-arabinose transferase-like glycosyltransferase